MPLERTRYPMPDFVREALGQRGLMDLYRQRTPYQQNGYIGSLCVARVKLEATKKKHLQQMLDELERGNVSINMLEKAIDFTIALT